MNDHHQRLSRVGVDDQHPFGVTHLDPTVKHDAGPPRRVNCYVRGCTEILHTPMRGFRGDTCPIHGIRCHFSSSGATYVYANVRRNAIASAELLATRIVHHPFKYESHRLGSERSEDALSWNVWRSLQEARRLAKIAEVITGDSIGIEPRLYLWGICLTDDDLKPWDLLIAARNRFESNLPVKRPLTEPDIALHLPGRYLILIEAKFTSSNPSVTPGPRANPSSLTYDELQQIYNDRDLTFLDRSRAQQAGTLYPQLWRNLVFAEWMARLDHPQTKAYHVNLVRDGAEEESAGKFHGLLMPEHRDRFQRLTWEDIHDLAVGDSALRRLRTYLQSKTAGLSRAFNLSAETS